MNRLRKFGAGLFVLFLLMLWGIAGHSVSCYAQGLNTVSASMVEPTKVKVTFNISSKKIVQIRLFRKEAAGKWEKIATLKGSAKSYKDTVKFNNEYYYYKAVAYQKQGKTSHTCSVYAGVIPVLWYGDADEQYIHPATTPTSVSMRAEIDSYSGGGLTPNGYEIYKSMDNKNFECIKAINTITKRYYTLGYVDTDVQKGQTYYYKLRGFFKYNKKKYYSPFSPTQTCIAANSRGIYSVKLLTEGQTALPWLDVCLTSDEGNADLTILNTGVPDWETGWELGDFVIESTSIYSPSFYSRVLITQYSTDGTNWSIIEEDSIVLKPGQTIYLRFELIGGGTFNFAGEEWAGIYEIPILGYSHDNVFFIDLIEQKAYSSEYID